LFKNKNKIKNNNPLYNYIKNIKKKKFHYRMIRKVHNKTTIYQYKILYIAAAIKINHKLIPKAKAKVKLKS
jgi:hypothetical protein